MDDEFRRQPVTAREPCLSGRTTAQRAAFLQQLGARRAMNGTIHTAPAQQRGIRGVDDGVDVELGDVGLDGAEGGHECY